MRKRYSSKQIMLAILTLLLAITVYAADTPVAVNVKNNNDPDRATTPMPYLELSNKVYENLMAIFTKPVKIWLKGYDKDKVETILFRITAGEETIAGDLMQAPNSPEFSSGFSWNGKRNDGDWANPGRVHFAVAVLIMKDGSVITVQEAISFMTIGIEPYVIQKPYFEIIQRTYAVIDNPIMPLPLIPFSEPIPTPPPPLVPREPLPMVNVPPTPPAPVVPSPPLPIANVSPTPPAPDKPLEPPLISLVPPSPVPNAPKPPTEISAVPETPPVPVEVGAFIRFERNDGVTFICQIKGIFGGVYIVTPYLILKQGKTDPQSTELRNTAVWEPVPKDKRVDFDVDSSKVKEIQTLKLPVDYFDGL